jgi:hypothetical protein
LKSVLRLKIPQDSPKIHPPEVKLQKVVNTINIDIYNYSLSMFHPFTHTPPRDARTRVYVCVYVRGGEKVNLEKQGGGRWRLEETWREMRGAPRHATLSGTGAGGKGERVCGCGGGKEKS